MEKIYILLRVDLQPGDIVGFTFFISFMAMMAASVFFFFERNNVDAKWRTSLLVSGLITFIAAVHYYYMRELYLEAINFNATSGIQFGSEGYRNPSPTQFRYIDWTLTVPLMCVEFFLLLRPYGAKTNMMWRLIGYSVFMLVTGYIGEAFAATAANPGMHSIVWGTISTIGYAAIAYEVTIGPVAKMAKDSGDAALVDTIRLLRNFILIGWGVYPIGYMAMPGGLLSSVINPSNLDLFYNIGDAVNKIGFGLVVYSMAVTATQREATKIAALAREIIIKQDKPSLQV